MRRQAIDILVTFNLSAENSKKLKLVKKKFDKYFIKEANVVFESASFHKQHQMPGESIDQPKPRSPAARNLTFSLCTLVLVESRMPLVFWRAATDRLLWQHSGSCSPVKHGVLLFLFRQLPFEVLPILSPLHNHLIAI
ncbi:hypothetical protein MRX96_020057 [Rhipicephalus microplus]